MMAQFHTPINRLKLSVLMPNGKTATVKFDKGVHITSDEAVIRALCKHPLYGAKFKMIESAEEYERVRTYNENRQTQYARGPALTRFAKPGKTQVVTDPIDTVADDQTTVQEIVAKTDAEAEDASPPKAAKRRTPRRKGGKR